MILSVLMGDVLELVKAIGHALRGNLRPLLPWTFDASNYVKDSVQQMTIYILGQLQTVHNNYTAIIIIS